MQRKLKADKDVLLTEYEIGNSLAQAYIKSSWTVVTIFLPICFGLVAVSFTKETLTLTSEKLIPLALASIFLYGYSWVAGHRYAGFTQSIFDRLREIEKEKGMRLHTKIKKDDVAKCRLLYVNTILFALLVIVWILRLSLAPRHGIWPL